MVPRLGPLTAFLPLRVVRRTLATPGKLEKVDFKVPHLAGIMSRGRGALQQATRSEKETGNAITAGTLTLLSMSRWPVTAAARSLTLVPLRWEVGLWERLMEEDSRSGIMLVRCPFLSLPLVPPLRAKDTGGSDLSSFGPLLGSVG